MVVVQHRRVSTSASSWVGPEIWVVQDCLDFDYLFIIKKKKKKKRQKNVQNQDYIVFLA
jgi:hypothetical protein